MLSKFPIGELKGIGTTILLIAVAIDIMVGGLTGLVAAASLAKEGAMESAINGMVALIGGVVAMLLVMMGITHYANTTKIGSIGFVMIAIGTTINAMVGALALLAHLHSKYGDGMADAMLDLTALSTIVGVFMLVAVACSKLKGSIGGLIVMGGAMAIITATLYAFAGIVATLGQLDDTAIERGKKALWSLVIAIGVLMTVFGLISMLAAPKGINVVAKFNISSFALNFLIFAGALLATAAAVWVFVDAAKRLYSLMQQIGSNGGDVLVNFFDSIFDPQVLNSAMNAFLNFMDQMIINVPFITAKIGAFLGVIAASTLTMLGPFIAFLLQSLVDILRVTADNIGPVVVELVRLIAAIIEALAVAVEDNQETLADGIVHLLEALWGLLIATLGKLWMKWEQSDAYKALENFGAWLYDAFESAGTWLQKALETFDGWIETGLYWLFHWPEELGNLIAEFFTCLVTDLGKWLWSILMSVWAWILDLWDSIKLGQQEIRDYIIEKIDNLVTDIKGKIEDFKNAGKDLIHGFFLGFTDEDEASKMTDAVTGFVDGIKNIIVGPLGFIMGSPSHWAEEQGQLVMEGFKNGVEESGPEAEASVSNVKDNMKAQVEDMRNNTQSLFDQKFKMPEIDTSAFTQSMAQLPQPEIDTTNMYNFADVLSQYEAEENPTMTITPVLDMDNLQYEDYAGGYDFGNMFGDGTSAFSLDTTNSLANMDAIDFESMMAENQPEPYDDTNVINAITQLNERLNEMAQGFADTDVRLDTGVLVGELVGPMDQALGQRATRTRRGG